MIVVPPNADGVCVYNEHYFDPLPHVVLYFLNLQDKRNRLRAYISCIDEMFFLTTDSRMLSPSKAISFPPTTYDATLAICAFHGVPTDELTCIVFRPEAFL